MVMIVFEDTEELKKIKKRSGDKKTSEQEMAASGGASGTPVHQRRTDHLKGRDAVPE
jgi:hypothetical protein